MPISSDLTGGRDRIISVPRRGACYTQEVCKKCFLMSIPRACPLGWRRTQDGLELEQMGSCESANVLTEGKQSYPAPSLLLCTERLLVNLPGESGRGLERVSGKLLFSDGMNVNRNNTCGHRARQGLLSLRKRDTAQLSRKM